MMGEKIYLITLIGFVGLCLTAFFDAFYWFVKSWKANGFLSNCTVMDDRIWSRMTVGLLCVVILIQLTKTYEVKVK